jgi:hypothetical protein
VGGHGPGRLPAGRPHPAPVVRAGETRFYSKKSAGSAAGTPRGALGVERGCVKRMSADRWVGAVLRAHNNSTAGGRLPAGLFAGNWGEPSQGRGRAFAGKHSAALTAAPGRKFDGPGQLGRSTLRAGMLACVRIVP